MKTEVEVCRESCGASYSAAHIGGCIAAIAIMVICVIAKRCGYLPASMTALRIMLLPVLAYGLIGAAMLWTLGRAIKRAKIADDLALLVVDVPRPV